VLVAFPLVAGQEGQAFIGRMLRYFKEFKAALI
jgi:hypothetical protein